MYKEVKNLKRIKGLLRLINKLDNALLVSWFENFTCDISDPPEIY